MSTQELIFAAIRAERKAQDDRWGESHDPGDGIMLSVLMEEVGEVAQALNEPWPNALNRSSVIALRSELVQVAAVAVRWLELLEGNNGRESGLR